MLVSPVIKYNEGSPEEGTIFSYTNDPSLGHWEFTNGDEKGIEYRNFSAMLSEASAAFIFIFLFMLCTDKKT